MLNENRSVFDAIMEVLEWLFDKMRGIADYSFSEIAEARKLFREALNEADAKAWGAEVRGDNTDALSRSEEWHPDLTRNQLDNLMKIIDIALLFTPK